MGPKWHLEIISPFLSFLPLPISYLFLSSHTAKTTSHILTLNWWLIILIYWEYRGNQMRTSKSPYHLNNPDTRTCDHMVWVPSFDCGGIAGTFVQVVLSLCSLGTIPTGSTHSLSLTLSVSPSNSFWLAYKMLWFLLSLEEIPMPTPSPSKVTSHFLSPSCIAKLFKRIQETSRVESSNFSPLVSCWASLCKICCYISSKQLLSRSLLSLCC